MLWHHRLSPPYAVTLAPPDGSGGGVFVPNQHPGEARQGQAAGPLGKRGNSLTLPPGDGGQTIRGNTEKPQENKAKRLLGRRDLVADQMRAASIYWHYANQVEAGAARKKLPGRGVTYCGWTQIADKPTELRRIQDESGYRSYFSGVQTCGLRWVCPCCTAKAAQVDRAYVNDGLAAARQAGLWPVMITMTTRHARHEAAADVIGGIIRAEQRLKTVKAWRRFSARISGYARVLEWTHGEHGHHPHFHTIALVQAGSEQEALAVAEELQAAYMRQLEAAGRDGTSEAAWRHSFHVQGAAAAGAYVAKWGSAEELTGALAKAGGGEGLTPWQLLRLARTASAERDRQLYASIWWQIVGATKGKAQLYKSEGWRDLVEGYRQGEDEEPQAEPELVYGFGQREKRGQPTVPWLDALPKRLAIREAAEAHKSLDMALMAVREAIREGPTDIDLVGGNDDDTELIEDCG